jgi:two-component system NarL family response regulator
LIRVLVVDDFKPWHNFVAAALERDPRYKVIGFASDGPGAVEQYQALRPDVILLDINLPGWSGIVAAQMIREIAPEAQILFFTNHTSLEFVTAALEIGARGFVAKLDGRELLSAINTVTSGEEYLSEQVRRFRSDPTAEKQK